MDHFHLPCRENSDTWQCSELLRWWEAGIPARRWQGAACCHCEGHSGGPYNRKNAARLWASAPSPVDLCCRHLCTNIYDRGNISQHCGNQRLEIIQSSLCRRPVKNKTQTKGKLRNTEKHWTKEIQIEIHGVIMGACMQVCYVIYSKVHSRLGGRVLLWVMGRRVR